MTCIVGLVHGRKVYVGGDSAGVQGWDLRVRADAKVFRNGPYVLGFTTSFRMGQVLRHAFDPPKPDAATDLAAFMATRFVDSARDALKGAGWAKKDSEREEGGAFLVGVAGRLFRVESDYQVCENVDGYDSIGCGAQVAAGALYATPRMAPRRRVECALLAAERMSAGVRAPFVVENT